MTLSKSIGLIFKALRKKEKLSTQEVGAIAKLPPMEILNVEFGISKDYTTLNKLAFAYGYKTSAVINMAEILKEDPTMSPEMLIAVYIAMEGIKNEKEEQDA